MSTLPAIEVAIATLDRPDNLARALAALADGEVLPRRVIVVDQSSGVESRAVVEGMMDRLPLLYVRSKRRGLAYNKNVAIKLAAGPYLAFTDDDCVADPRWVLSLAQTFAGPDAPDGLSGRVLPLGEERPGLYAVSSRTSSRAVTYSGKAPPWEVGTGGNMAVSLGWLRKVGGFDPRLGAGAPLKAGEDIDIIYRLLIAGARLRYEPAALIYHERQTLQRRIATRYGYGMGIGAFLAFRLRAGDPYAVRLLFNWLVTRSWVLAGNLRRRETRQLREEALFLQGTIAGLLRGILMNPRRRSHGPARGDRTKGTTT
ncbi:MAG TPA: glycosyltransferase [Chloroflexia bacterium]